MTNNPIDYTNIFHFTTGGNFNLYSDRCPSLFLNFNSWHLKADVNETKNIMIYSGGVVPLHVFSQFHYEQRFNASAGKHVVKLFIDNTLVKEAVNNDPRDFQNVKVYLSDDWKSASEVILKDFKYGIL